MAGRWLGITPTIDLTKSSTSSTADMADRHAYYTVGFHSFVAASILTAFASFVHEDMTPLLGCFAECSCIVYTCTHPRHPKISRFNAKHASTSKQDDFESRDDKQRARKHNDKVNKTDPYMYGSETQIDRAKHDSNIENKKERKGKRQNRKLIKTNCTQTKTKP